WGRAVPGLARSPRLRGVANALRPGQRTTPPPGAKASPPLHPCDTMRTSPAAKRARRERTREKERQPMKPFAPCCGATLICCAAQLASADVLFDNFGPGDTYSLDRGQTLAYGGPLGGDVYQAAVPIT